MAWSRALEIQKDDHVISTTSWNWNHTTTHRAQSSEHRAATSKYLLHSRDASIGIRNSIPWRIDGNLNYIRVCTSTANLTPRGGVASSSVRSSAGYRCRNQRNSFTRTQSLDTKENLIIQQRITKNSPSITYPKTLKGKKRAYNNNHVCSVNYV